MSGCVVVVAAAHGVPRAVSQLTQQGEDEERVGAGTGWQANPARTQPLTKLYVCGRTQSGSTSTSREGLVRREALHAQLKQVRATIAILKSKWMVAGIEQASVEGMLKQLERESPLHTRESVPVNSNLLPDNVRHPIFPLWDGCDRKSGSTSREELTLPPVLMCGHRTWFIHGTTNLSCNTR